jgi:hypothetical protein
MFIYVMKVIIYWILDLEDAVHSTWDLWINGPQECKGNSFLKLGRVGNKFRWGSKFLKKNSTGLSQPLSDTLWKFVRGGGGVLNVLHLRTPLIT